MMTPYDWPDEPVLLFDVAREVFLCSFRIGGIALPYLVFSRSDKVTDQNGELKRGVRLAIFSCDDDGKANFQERYECEGRDFDAAFARFRYLYVNGLIAPILISKQPRVYEIEAEQLDSMLYES